MFVCIHVCEYVYDGVCVCMVDRGQPQVSFHRNHLSCFLSLPGRLDWQVGESRDPSACLHLPSTGIARVGRHARLLF